MIRAFVLILIFFFGWSSPQFRISFANILRRTAVFIEPKESINSNPKQFTIPNPFYREKKDSVSLLYKDCGAIGSSPDKPCFDRLGSMYSSFYDYKLTIKNHP